jgi:hypothetical protein
MKITAQGRALVYSPRCRKLIQHLVALARIGEVPDPEANPLWLVAAALVGAESFDRNRHEFEAFMDEHQEEIKQILKDILESEPVQ